MIINNDNMVEYSYNTHNIFSNFSVDYIYAANFNSEIIQCDIDLSKTLLIINSNDRVLRLFKIDNNIINYFKDYYDPISKKKWMNCYFYSSTSWNTNKYNINNVKEDNLFNKCNTDLKINNMCANKNDTYNNLTYNEKEFLHSIEKAKSKQIIINNHKNIKKQEESIQNLIVSALFDSSSIEFVILDLETSNIINKLEPYKYNCSDFIIHSSNYFSLVVISGKKLYQIYGYYINHWENLAPHFKYIESNVEYIPNEEFYDDLKKKINELDSNKFNFNENTTINKNNNYISCQSKNNYIYNKNKIKEMFKPKNREQLTFYYKIDVNDIFTKYSSDSLNDIKSIIQSNKINSNK